MGIERLMDLVVMPENKKEGYYIGAMSDDALKKVMKLVIELRKSNVVHTQYVSKSIKAHMKAADKVNAKYFVCIGDNELQSKTYVVKDLDTKEEKSVELRD